MTDKAWRHPLAVESWGEEERRAAIAVIERGRTTMGAKVAEFENDIARAFGAKYAVMVNSGSSANLLAVASLFFTDPPRARPGQVAIVPAVSWATTYFPLTQLGLKLRFVDIDPGALNLHPGGLEAALDDDVAVVFAVDLLGNPNDFARIGALLAGRDITLLEDGCEAMGARFESRFAGTFGAVGTFSTFFSHHLSTMEGGLCVTNDEEIHEILLSLRAHGWTRELPPRSRLRGAAPSDAFKDAFRFVLPGYNVRPLEICGAVGVEQLRKLPAFVARRRANAARFRALFSDIPGVRLQSEIGESSWYGFALTLTDEAEVGRGKVVERLTRAGIECRPIVAGNFVNHPVMAHLAHDPPPPLPNADGVDANGFYFGNSHLDLSQSLEEICAAVRSALSAA